MVFHDPIDNVPVQAVPVVPESVNIDINYSDRIVSNKVLCEYFFNEGVLNQKALQILERMAELVYAQAELIESVPVDQIIPPDPGFKYNPEQVDLMTKGRDTHTGTSPVKTKRVKLIVPSATIDMVNEAILSVSVNDKENINILINQADNLGDNKKKSISINVLEVTKLASKYEVPIYEAIKGSNHFPRMFSHDCFDDEEGDSMVNLRLETLSPLSEIFLDFLEKDPEFLTRILIDVMGALRVLHSKGYVHGDVTPGNVGFNENRQIWNLFDFDNSRPIEEAAAADSDDKYKFTKGYLSKNYAESGCYFPFDDYVGLAFTCESVMDKLSTFPEEFELKFRKFLNLIKHCLDSELETEQLDFLYLEALKLHLEFIKTPVGEDLSIKAALPLLEDIKNKYN